MRSYTAEKYRSLVEATTDPRLQHYMDEERSFIARTPRVGRRTIVDLGAGHGRVLGDLAHLGERVIAIEINPDMYGGLAQRAASLRLGDVEDEPVAEEYHLLRLGIPKRGVST